MRVMNILLAVGILGWALAGCSGSDNKGDNGSDDPIRQQCGEDIWCYHDAVVASGDVDKCDDILNYWNDEDRGVVGSCQYEIAVATQDCSICSRIEKSDIRSSCNRDAC